MSNADPIRHIAVAMKAPSDVIPHLGKPSHWKQGRSAKAIADSWFAANDLPATVRGVIEQSKALAGAELLDAWLERCVDLGDGERHTQTDAMAILGLGDGLAALAIEGKVDESFGPFVHEWLDAPSPKRPARLAYLAGLLGLDPAACAPLRYQFLHRTASAILEARRYRATKAIMLVQSFCPRSSGFADYAAFVVALGLAAPERDRLIGPIETGGVTLWLGWVCDEAMG